jgi:hypothetical protein
MPTKRRAPKCQLVGPKGESIPLPETVFYVLAVHAALHAYVICGIMQPCRRRTSRSSF